jgi:tetratricopeptide (TPR) repeat protein
LLFFTGIAHAKYRYPDLEKVPLKRLIENLEKKQAASPKDPQLLRNLAQIYSMAYSSGLNDDSKVDVARGSDVVYVDKIVTIDKVPFARLPMPKDKEIKRSTAYLEKAVSYYKMAYELDKTNILTMLGLGWCSDQLGGKNEAIKLYREVIAEAWKEEKHRGHGEY